MDKPKLDEKAPMVSPLAKIERHFIDANVKRIPNFIESHHLTLATILWSILVLLFAYLASGIYEEKPIPIGLKIHWLWGSSFVIFMQWVTDCFDGAVGRYRKTGLIKWGFYMDHLLDFIFMWCLIVSYSFLVITPQIDLTTLFWIFSFAMIYLCLMVSSFLTLSALGDLKITYLGFGPTEIRLLFIVLNTCIIFLGTNFLKYLFPIATIIIFLGFLITVISEAKKIWIIDMKNKSAK